MFLQKSIKTLSYLTTLILVVIFVSNIGIESTKASSETVYVNLDTGTNHASNCTNSATPCKEIYYAVNTYFAGAGGGTVYVTGTFDQTDTFTTTTLDNTHSGTASTPLIITQWPGQSEPVIDGTGTIKKIGFDLASGIEYVQISNFTIQDLSNQGIRVHADPNAVSNITLSNLTVTGCGGGGFLSQNGGCTNCTIENSTFSNNGSFDANGINIDAGSNITIDNVTANDNAGPGFVTDTVTDLTISDSTFNSNGDVTAGAGIYIATSTASSITITGTTTNSNATHGVQCDGTISSPLDITITDHTANSNTTNGVYTVSCVNLTIMNSTMNQNSSSGIDGSATLSATISNNTVSSNSNHGMNFNGTNNSTISDNTVSGNSSYGIVFSTFSSGNTVSGNTVSDNLNGIGFSQSNSGVVTRNTINGHTGANTSGIVITNSDEVTVTNNIIYDNTYGMIIMNGADDNKMINNTFFNNSTIGILVMNMGIGGATGSVLTNNIFSSNLDSGEMGISVDADSISGFTSDYNLFNWPAGVTYGQWSGVDHASLAEWQQASGQDTNSIEGDPLFTSTTSGSENLHLSGAASPCIDAGTSDSNTPPTDIDNATRPYDGSLVDIGADEATFPGLASSLAATPTATTAALTWTAPYGDPTSYTISYGTDEAASNIGTTTSTSASASLSGLTANTIHYFKVLATNATGDGLYSSAASFTTLPDVPTLLSSSSITDTTATFSWTAPSGTITSYTLQYDTNSDFSSATTVTDLTETSYSAASLNDYTVYYWRVLAVASGGSSSYSDTANFTTLLSAPNTPTGLANTDITSTTAKAGWTASNNSPSSYTLSYGTDINASNLGTVASLTDVNYQFTSLTAGTTHYWKIMAIGPDYSSEYSSITSFTTRLGSPEDVSVIDASRDIEPTQATITWSATTGATGYVISYGTDTSASNLDNIWLGSDTTSYTLQGLVPSTTYYYKIASIDAQGVGDFSSVGSFTTDIASLGLLVTG